MIGRLIVIAVLSFAFPSAAQVQGCLIERRTLPDDLQRSLQSQLSSFLAAQAQEHWETAGEFLGGCPGGCRKGSANKESNRCLVLRMQELRLLDFQYSSDQMYVCPASLLSAEEGAPVFSPAAEQLTWHLSGVGRFRTSRAEWSQPTEIVAYRDSGQWRFEPPQANMTKEWERVHFREADFAEDQRNKFKAENSRESPIEIAEIHAYMDRQYPSLLNVKFRLHNKTEKTVSGLAWTISVNGEVGIIEQGPFEIAPHADIDQQESVSVRVDLCDVADPQEVNSIRVEDVYFADGSR